MANTSSITGMRQATTLLNRVGIDYGQNFNKEVSNRARRLAQKMQIDMNNAIAGGPVPFTSKAVLFRFYRNTQGQAVNVIMIKNIQAQYLYDVLVKPKNLMKIIPTSSARLNANGNIVGLRSGLKSGKYKVIDTGGKDLLIDTSKKGKARSKRVIGVRERKKRKIVYDFYAEAEKGARLILAGVQGHFRFTGA